MSKLTPEKLASLRLDMYNFSKRLGLGTCTCLIIAQNAADSARGIGQHEGCENDRENAKRICAEIECFCVDILKESESWAKELSRQSAFCEHVLTLKWYWPSLHCDLPRGHSLEQHEDSTDEKKRSWWWNHRYRCNEIGEAKT